MVFMKRYLIIKLKSEYLLKKCTSTAKSTLLQQFVFLKNMFVTGWDLPMSATLYKTDQLSSLFGVSRGIYPTLYE